ncbi:hypothetical protein GOP47_0022300 [Adiantum capillus-veneris]|uniref:SET domain-containing protein n=1 Tax=Adiantum capillus-veneris TaxID=13818 RepID=A0A9D4UA18_ADICA|nr:hypothetical protein GOP47_0022300 [Adiantum capillus-veneris]
MELCRFLSTTSFSDDSQEALDSLHSFNKPGILAAHLQLQALVKTMPPEAKSMRTVLQHSLLQHDPFLKPASLAPAASNPGLTSTTLADLRVGKWHQGKYLHGFLAVDAPLLLYGKFLVSIFEEKESDAAARLVMNDLFHNLTLQVPPPGSQVIIKEPCLIKDHFGRATYIWLPNPASLEVVAFYVKPHLALGRHVNCAVACLELGNMEHSKGKYAAAIAFYSRSVEIAQAEDAENKLLALSNRAESWLKLECFDKGLADAESALAIDASHVKSIFRKVRALWKMYRYQTAFKFMTEQMDLLPPAVSDRLQEVYKDAALLNEQSMLGNHDLSEFFQNGCEAKLASPLAEFVGPVRIGLSSDSGGRGLFLTSDVSAGDLLMVIDSFAAVKVSVGNWVSRSDDIQKVQPGLLAEVIRSCLATPRNLSRLYAMYEGQHPAKPAPNISLFKPIPDPLQSEEDETEVPLLLDVSRLRAIIFAATDIESRLVDETDLMGGLWLLLSLMNNSCIPNVCVRLVGNIKVVLASRDMKAGTELHRTYTSPLLPYFSRIESFACRCPRCHFERELPQLEQLAKQYVKLFFQISAPNELERVRAVELYKVALELEKYIRLLKLADKETKWLRTAFAEAYATAYSSCFQPPADLPRVEDFVEAILETASGDLGVLKLVFCLSKKLLDRRCLDLINKHFKAYFGHQTSNVIEAVKLKERQGCRKVWVR